jgi:subtilisin family serine protease
VTAAGGTIRFAYTIVPAVAASLPAAAVAALASHPRVAFIEPDIEVTAVDAELDSAWGVKQIGAGVAHAATPPIVGAGVHVAVIDSGIDYTHPDLFANYAGGWDFYSNDADPMDDCGHGTHVAGTVAAASNSEGVVGVAPGVRLYALRVLAKQNGNQCSGPTSGIIAAIDWAARNGIQVTNNSYGSTSPSATADQAFANAAALGIVHVAGAGNNGTCDGAGDSVIYPAGYRSVIAVAAVNSLDARACFSSTGPDVEVAAPGVQINSTLLGGGYGLKGGTSMASPHVAGTAALLLGEWPADANGNGRVNDEVRNAIAASALDLGTAGRDPLYGFGRVVVPDALAAAAATPPLTVSVDRISYVASGGGKGKSKDLTVTISTVYGLAAPVSATVGLEVYCNGVFVTSGTVTTDQAGLGSLLLRNAPAGTYQTIVTWATSPGLDWDARTPPNSFVK